MGLIYYRFGRVQQTYVERRFQAMVSDLSRVISGEDTFDVLAGYELIA
jgi:hypothetical protein